MITCWDIHRETGSSSKTTATDSTQDPGLSLTKAGATSQKPKALNRYCCCCGSNKTTVLINRKNQKRRQCSARHYGNDTLVSKQYCYNYNHCWCKGAKKLDTSRGHQHIYYIEEHKKSSQD